MYHGKDYDLAGFCVGIVEKDSIIDGLGIKPGDTVIGLASSGVHSNGFSLVRKVISETGSSLVDQIGERSLVDVLLEPTRIYVKSVRKLLESTPVKGIAHITGGGLIENIPRVLPANTQVELEKSSWRLPEIFQWLQNSGNISDTEMYTVFNCGVGLVLIVDKDLAKNIVDFFNQNGETAWQLGKVSSREETDSPQVIFV